MNIRAGGRGVLVAALSLLLAGVGLVSPAPAQAEATLTLTGRGFGHGHGMSQYGARDRAAAGHLASSILAAYYPGTTAADSSDGSWIRVRVETDTDNQTTVVSESGMALEAAGRDRVALPTRVAGSTPTQWRLRLSSSTLVAEARVGGSWRAHGSSDVTRFLSGRTFADLVSGDGTVRLVLGSIHREYQGKIRAARPAGTSGSLRTVVITQVSAYLPSVVTSEMPSSWPTQALRAQAVAARTYALFDRAAKPASSYFDTCDTTSCQVFNGRADYTTSGALVRTWSVDSTRSAVSSTAGRYLSYDGGPAFTQFSASNGGYSAIGSRPYLRAAADPYDAFPVWTVELSGSQLGSVYRSIGTFTGVSTTRDGRGSYGGRVSSIRITGTSGSVTVTGNEFRSAFGLRSTLFATAVESGVLPAPARDIAGDAAADALAVTDGGALLAWRSDRPVSLTGLGRVGTGWDDRAPLTLAHDLAGTGGAELLAVSPTTNRLLAYPALGDGRFAADPTTVDSRSWEHYTRLVAVEDVDGSGPGMIAVGRSGALYHLDGDGGDGLGARQQLGVGWDAKPLVAYAGDFDGDGDGDLVSTDSAGRLWLHPGDGQGGFGQRRVVDTGWQNVLSVIGAGDWDHDGRLDLLAVGRTGTRWIYRGDGRGGFSGRIAAAEGFGSYRLVG